jgi:hypothetical protein
VGYKRKPKVRQELDSFSGVKKKRKKRVPPYQKPMLSFSFTFNEIEYTNGTGRIKITTEGGVQLLIQNVEGVWIGVKGILNFIKIKKISNVVIPKSTLRPKKVRRNKR